MKTYLIPLLLVCCFCIKKRREEPCIGCNSLPPNSETFVGSYNRAGGLHAENVGRTLNNEPYFVSVKVIPKQSYPAASRDTFNLYAKLYNDNGFNNYYPVTNILVDTISNITVATLFDIDNNHKKGDTINDIMQIRYQSVFDYIQARYTGPTPDRFSQILTDFNAKKKLLVKSDWISLYMLIANPTSPKQQYAVHMRFTNGKVISDTTGIFE